MACSEEKALKASSETSQTWLFYLLLQSGQSMSPFVVADMVAHNTKFADKEVFSDAQILFTDLRAAMLTACLKAKDAKLKVTILELHIPPSLLRQTQARIVKCLSVSVFRCKF